MIRIRNYSVAAWASPIADAKGRIYFVSGGRRAVVQAGDEFKVLAANDLGDGGHAGPAASNGRLFIVGDTKLWCIAEPPAAHAAGFWIQDSRLKFLHTGASCVVDVNISEKRIRNNRYAGENGFYRLRPPSGRTSDGICFLDFFADFC